jgi:hypothetical protein
MLKLPSEPPLLDSDLSETRARTGWLYPETEWFPFDSAPERQRWRYFGADLCHCGSKTAQKRLKSGHNLQVLVTYQLIVCFCKSFIFCDLNLIEG